MTDRSKHILCRFIEFDCRTGHDCQSAVGAGGQHGRDRQTHRWVRSAIFSRPFAIRKLVLEGANLHLWRDADAHANWIRNGPWNNPGQRAASDPQPVIPAAHLNSTTTADT